MRTMMKWSVVVFAILVCGFECSAQELSPHIRFPRATTSVSTTWATPLLCQNYTFPRGLTGGGVIGILELGGGYKQADLDSFTGLYGMPKIQTTDISVNGGVNSYTGSNADFEVALDIQVAAATYYYSTGKMPTIKVFFAPNSFGSFASVVNTAVANGCDVLSVSWGAPEKNWPRATLTSLETTIATAATKGLVVFASAGDFSSSDGGTGNNVDGPACCPHVVACGGTTKFTTTETVWGTGTSTDGGTGGGYSTIFPVQSFQIGAPTGPGRMVPDISANADPNTGYTIVVGGYQYIIGGTSAVSPLYSGFFAACGKKLGFITPKLWQNQSSFIDIKTGSIGGYSAKVGPDACTGLGVPKGAAIAALFGAGNGIVTRDYNLSTLGIGTSYQQPPKQVSISGDLQPRVTQSNVLTPVDGKIPSQPGNFTAVIFDKPGGKSSIFGIGGELNLGGLNLFLFSGSE